MPADTAFTPQFLATVDVVVAMYHDQGLPVIKHAGFGNAVNVTLGLPIVRTSVDHGTALSLARTGRADAGSLRGRLDAGDRAGGRTAVAVRKRFGQHFLHDPAVIRRIIEAVAPASGERIVEVGPGRGALTWGLLERAKHLDVIEIDRDLARALQADSACSGRTCECTSSDVLDTDFVRLRADGAPLRIVGNLPYNISTPLLFRLLSQRAAIADMHFMLQKEVVDRMAAQPGGKGLRALDRHARRLRGGRRPVRGGSGRFSAAARRYGRPSCVCGRAPQPRFAIGSDGALRALVTAAFSHRRKTLRNGLKGLLTGEDIESCGIDPQLRPETLAPAQFGRLAAHYCRLRGAAAAQSA